MKIQNNWFYKWTLVFCFAVYSIAVLAQNNCLNEKDKLRITGASSDDARGTVFESILIQNSYQDSTYQRCILSVLFDFAKKDNSNKLYALYYNFLIQLLNQYGEQDKVEASYTLFKFYNQNNPNTKKKNIWNCQVQLQMIHLYNFSGRQIQAIGLADSTLELAKMNQDTSTMIHVLRRLCQINQSLDNWKEAENYIDRGKILTEKIINKNGEDLIFWLDLHSDWLWTKLNNEKFDECEKILPIYYSKATQVKDPTTLSDYFNFSAALQKIKYKNYKNALFEIDSSIYYANILEAPNMIVESNFEKCEILKELKMWKELLIASNSLQRDVEKYNSKEFVSSIYYLNSLALFNLGNYKKAYEQMQLYKIANDSFIIHTKEDLLQKYNVKFETKEKEAKIDVLQQQQNAQQAIAQKRLWLILALLLFLALISLATFFYYKNSEKEKQLANQEKELQLEKIIILEKEKQLIAANSIIQGQEEERTRLGRDLHDGLGGLLSGVKLNLGAVGNQTLNETGYKMFQYAIEKLDESILELRRVSHNMIPESLHKFGLQIATENFCNGFLNSNNLTIIHQFYGLESRIDSTTELICYRIIQELINNAIKHADATQILVQVTRQNELLQITIEDNGKGFEYSKINIKESSGLQNIESRVNYLNGKMDINSNSNGTSFLIEIPLTLDES